MMAPGIAPEIQDRWEVLWAWLCSHKKTREDQTRRLQELEFVLREARELTESMQRVPQHLWDRIESLRQACISPFLFHPLRRLFACRSDWGLIFIFAMPMRLREVMAEAYLNAAPIALRPLGVVETYGGPDEIHDIFVSSRAAIPKEQIHPWAEAAATYGYLFELKDPKDLPEIPQ